MAGRDVGAQIGRINSKLKGWSSYFRLGTVRKAYRTVDSHVCHRVRPVVVHEIQRYGVRERHGSRTSTCTGSWDYTEISTNVTATVRGRKCEAEDEGHNLVRKPGAGSHRTPGLMSGMWKRSTAKLIEAPATERAGNR